MTKHRILVLMFLPELVLTRGVWLYSVRRGRSDL
jgi:hypothetical protein